MSEYYYWGVEGETVGVCTSNPPLLFRVVHLGLMMRIRSLFGRTTLTDHTVLAAPPHMGTRKTPPRVPHIQHYNTHTVPIKKGVGSSGTG